MKFLITENKLNDIILNHIKGYYNWNKITVLPDDVDEDNAFFHNPESEIGDIFFYNGEDKSLEIYDDDFLYYMKNMFNEIWIPVFKKFIKDEFDINVKWIEYFI